MRVLMLGGLLLASAFAGAAAAPAFPGTYRNETLMVEINEEQPGKYFGVFLAGNDVHEFAAKPEGSALVGSYAAGAETRHFRMTLKGTDLAVVDGQWSYVLARQADPAAPAVAPLRVNRTVIPEATVQSFEQVYRMQLPRGDYWYDRVSGAWGLDGGPTAGFTTPGMNLGGTLPADASRGNTGVFINGRELPMQDVAGLMQMNVPVQRGRWWVDNAGNFGVEGVPVSMGNLFQYSRGHGGAYQRATAGGYIGGDGNTSYFFDPSTGSSVMLDH